MSHERLCIPASHPSLEGHFPGRPIVPGVVLLATVLAHVRARLGKFTLHAVRSVKFVLPVRPDEPFELQVEEPAPGVVRFRCVAERGTLAEGSLEIER